MPTELWKEQLDQRCFIVFWHMTKLEEITTKLANREISDTDGLVELQQFVDDLANTLRSYEDNG